MSTVNYVAMTVSANAPKYIFHVELSDYEIDKLKYHTWLGFRFPKNKINFIKDLSDVLALDICERFIEMDKEGE